MKYILWISLLFLGACEDPVAPKRGVQFDERFGPCYIHCVQGGVRDPRQIHYKCVKMCRACLRDHPLVVAPKTCGAQQN